MSGRLSLIAGGGPGGVSRVGGGSISLEQGGAGGATSMPLGSTQVLSKNPFTRDEYPAWQGAIVSHIMTGGGKSPAAATENVEKQKSKEKSVEKQKSKSKEKSVEKQKSKGKE